MGRRLDVLLGRTTKQTARLKSYLGLAVTRLGVLRGHRQVRCSQARGDVEQLLRLGHPDRALLRAEQVIREQDMLDVFLMLEAYCNLITERIALIDAHRECPGELREAAAGLVYAATRCGDLPELQEVRRLLAAKFGREFASDASDLRSGCGISTKIVQKLSTKQPSLESRQMVLQEIAAEKGITYTAPPREDSASSNQRRRKKRGDDESPRTQPRVGTERDDDDISAHSPQKYKDVEAAAQAAFESAATAAAAAKAAIELSRGDDDRRRPGRVQVGMTKKEMLDDDNDDEDFADGGESFQRIGHARNYSSEIEISPEEERHENIARDPVRSKPASVRTRRGF